VQIYVDLQILPRPLARIVAECAEQVLVVYGGFGGFERIFWRYRKQNTHIPIQTVALIAPQTLEKLLEVHQGQPQIYYTNTLEISHSASKIDGFLQLFPGKTHHPDGPNLVEEAIEWSEEEDAERLEDPIVEAMIVDAEEKEEARLAFGF